jgi:hypothetical protein
MAVGYKDEPKTEHKEEKKELSAADMLAGADASLRKAGYSLAVLIETLARQTFGVAIDTRKSEAEHKADDAKKAEDAKAK